MKQITNSLYWKISAIFLLLLLALGSVEAYISVKCSMDFVKESDQKLNYRLAGDLAEKFSPFLKDSLDVMGIERMIHEMMVMNPRVEIYLIDDQGDLMAYFAEPERIKRMSVNIEPVKRFLDKNASSPIPIYGDDPRSPDRQKIFSAASVLIEGQKPGYLYVILSSEEHDSIAAMLEESYIIKTSLITLSVCFGFTGIVGLILFFFLTKRLRHMRATVQQFEQGEFQQRIQIDSNDEIGQLGRTFNQMADSVIISIGEMEKNDKLRRELIANVSHDLRTPLASIQGYLETVLMKDETLTPEKRRAFMETILNNVKTLIKLVTELFDLSKLDAKQTKSKPEPFSIAELAQDVMLKFQPHAQKRNINLHASLPKKLPFVYADIGMIERVLSNLIDNALNYTYENGEVKIELIHREDKVQVKVSDTGIGIPTEDLPYVFDRFYRVEKSRSKSSKGGAGLGLAIAKKMVKAHNSEIYVESAVDIGTTFAFNLAILDERSYN